MKFRAFDWFIFIAVFVLLVLVSVFSPVRYDIGVAEREQMQKCFDSGQIAAFERHSGRIVVECKERD